MAYTVLIWLWYVKRSVLWNTKIPFYIPDSRLAAQMKAILE